jgi:hypothetical protein
VRTLEGHQVWSGVAWSGMGYFWPVALGTGPCVCREAAVASGCAHQKDIWAGSGVSRGGGMGNSGQWR